MPLANKVRLTHLPSFNAPNPEPGPKRMMLPQGEFTLLHPACPEARFLAFLTFPVGTQRGGHFHKTRTEFLYVLKGDLSLTVRDRESGESSKLLVNEGSLIELAPNVEHTYHASSYAEAIEFSATPHDPSDTIRVVHA